ncbi:unnamed protein product, partial [Effrenium voratum]
SIPVAPSREPMFLGAPPAAPTSNPNFGVNASSTQKPRIPYMWPKHVDDWRWSKGFEATYCFEEVGLPHAMLEVARRILGQGSRFPTRVADASDCNVEVTAWGSLLVRPKGTGGDIEKAKKMLFEVLHPAAEALRSEAFMVEKDAPDSNPDAEAVGVGAQRCRRRPWHGRAGVGSLRVDHVNWDAYTVSVEALVRLCTESVAMDVVTGKPVASAWLILQEAWDQLCLALPVSGANLLQRASLWVTLMAAGQFGKEVLAPVSLTNSVNTVFGVAALGGLTVGISTLTSQAFGAGSNFAVAAILPRALLVALLGSLPCVLTLVFIKQISLSFHMEEAFASVAGNFGLSVLLVAPCTGIQQSIGAWLVAQNNTRPWMCVTLSVLPLHAVMTVYFSSTSWTYVGTGHYNGVLASCGQQKFSGQWAIRAYLGVSLPFAVLFAFAFDWGVVGLCAGHSLGKLCHVLACMFTVWRIDWDMESYRAIQQVEKESDSMTLLV